MWSNIRQGVQKNVLTGRERQCVQGRESLHEDILIGKRAKIGAIRAGNCDYETTQETNESTVEAVTLEKSGESTTCEETETLRERHSVPFSLISL